MHAASPGMSSEEVGRGLAATVRVVLPISRPRSLCQTRVYTSHTWAAFHAEWSAYRQIPPPYLSIPEPEASPHLIAGILVSEDGFLANICNANKTELSKLFAVKVSGAMTEGLNSAECADAQYELLSETLWLQILRDLSNHAKAASADKRPERDRRRPTSYFCEIAPEDFVPLALRSHKALPLKTSPARCKSSATPLWSKPSPRKSKSSPVTPKSHKKKPATPSSSKASHLPHTPHSSSALSISTSPCQSKAKRLVPVVDLTDTGSPKRRSGRTSTFSSSPKAKSTRRAEIMRRAHATQIVGGGITENRLARTLSREVRHARLQGRNPAHASLGKARLSGSRSTSSGFRARGRMASFVNICGQSGETRSPWGREKCVGFLTASIQKDRSLMNRV